MRIGELSRKTGVPVPTIKYYVREGLLPSGELTSRNQAVYGETHERRLRLIRALLDVGGMRVAEIAEVLAAVDDPERPLHDVLGTVSGHAGDPGPRPEDAGAVREVPEVPEDPETAAAREVVAELVSRRGWGSLESRPAADLVRALAAMARLGHASFTEVLDDYADAAERVARADLGYLDRQPGVEKRVETAVVGTVLGEAVLGALRRMAHADASERLYGGAAVRERRP
ncbi:MerR family transcriptional regulator [Streptomyces sp. NPDC002734]|uniref:MerR family transcriptional regulator n=1 Tax=Streptomyces sp. NPDC002734 TaxID=3154426 RepID=UPI00331C909A